MCVCVGGGGILYPSGLAHSCLFWGVQYRPPIYPDSPSRPSQPRLPGHCQRCAVPWQTAEDPATDPGPGGEFGWGWPGQWVPCGDPWGDEDVQNGGRGELGAQNVGLLAGKWGGCWWQEASCGGKCTQGPDSPFPEVLFPISCPPRPCSPPQLLVTSPRTIQSRFLVSLPFPSSPFYSSVHMDSPADPALLPLGLSTYLFR